MRKLIAVFFAVIIGCAQKEKYTSPYCYPDPVAEAIGTLKPIENVCRHEDKIVREACFGKYMNAQTRVEEIKMAIRKLGRNDLSEPQRKFYAESLQKSLSVLDCSFFQKCPQDFINLIRDCDRALPRSSLRREN